MGTETDLVDRLPWERGAPRIIECRPGWYSLIEQLHVTLTELCVGYEVLQVKEKFGGLRYYVSLPAGLDSETQDRAWAAVAKTEAASFTVCEECGQPGELLCERHYWRTLCLEHRRPVGT